MVSRLQRQVSRFEQKRCPVKKKRYLVVYENDPLERPNPTPEELADPDVEVTRVIYIDHWPPDERDGRA